MSTFPLYDNLNINIPKKDLTARQKDEIVKNIQTLNHHAKELIYALIQFYARETGIQDNLPFNCIQTVGDGKEYNVSWNIQDLPIPLRHIIHKFLTMHLRTQNEEVVKRS